MLFPELLKIQKKQGPHKRHFKCSRPILLCTCDKVCFGAAAVPQALCRARCFCTWCSRWAKYVLLVSICCYVQFNTALPSRFATCNTFLYFMPSLLASYVLCFALCFSFSAAPCWLTMSYDLGLCLHWLHCCVLCFYFCTQRTEFAECAQNAQNVHILC